MSEFLDRLVARYTDEAFTAPPATATDAVVHDRFDAATWGEVRADVPVIDTMIVDLEREHDQVEDFMRDFFMDWVKADPKLRDAAEMAPSHLPNRGMLAHLETLPEMAALRSVTRNDPFGSAMAMVSMSGQLAELFTRSEQARERAKEQQAAQDAARQAAQEARAALEEAASGGDEEAAADAVDRASGAAQQAQDAAQNTQDATDAAMAGMNTRMRKAARQAAQDVDDETSLMHAYGVSDGELQAMPFKERLELSRRLKTTRLAKFAKLIGQFRQLEAAERRRRVRHVPDEITSVTLGDDLTRLAPSELIALGTDELEDDFWLRYANRELLVYDLSGRERMGQGPIVVVCDESGSMTAQDMAGGTREAWSKAFTLALAERARSQGRDFHYIGFSSKAQQWSTRFDKGRATLEQVITMTEHFYGGGTHFETPLLMALDVVESYDGADGQRPDVVFITDDCYRAPDEEFMHRWNRTRDKLDVRCFGVAIGTDTSGALSAVSDNVRSLSEMASDPQTVSDIFRTV